MSKVNPVTIGLLTVFCVIFAQGAQASPKDLPSAPRFSVAPDDSDRFIATMGLTAEQRAAIFTLTMGEIDFRNIFIDTDRYGFNPGLQGFRQAVETSRLISRMNEPPGWLSVNSDADPYLAEQWWLDALELEKAWSLASGKGVTIADCDAGYYLNESDLIPNLLVSKRYDLSDKDNRRTVDDGKFVFHGTAVAAIMVAAKDGKGTNGIAYNAKLVPLQNFNYLSELDDINKEEATAACVLRAIAEPEVDIIVVASQTHYGSSETFLGTRNAIKLAVKSGIPVIVAAGDNSKQLSVEEKDDTGSIIVGALRADGSTANFSNKGERVSLSSYGEKITTLTGPNGRIKPFAGTPAAAAQVAATVALMFELNPVLIPDHITSILKETRTISESNRDVGGKLDIYRSLLAALRHQGDQVKKRELSFFRQRVIDIINGKS